MCICLDLFAGLAGGHFIQDVQERGKLAFSVERVHIVIDGNVAYTLAGEIDVRVLSGQDVISSQTG